MNNSGRVIRMAVEPVGKRCLPPGYTLVEIMISMVIALIVMGGVYRTLADEDINHDQSEKILDMQNNARVAIERIARDVRRTGSLGCGGTLASSTLNNWTIAETDFINKYTIASTTAVPPGLDWNGTKAILSVLKDTDVPVANVNYLSEVIGFADNAAAGPYQVGTDAITLVYLSDERQLASEVGTASPFTINLSASAYDKNDILYLTDCLNYSLLQKSNGAGTTVAHAVTGLNTTEDLGKNYGSQTTAWISKLNTATYFIHDNGKFELCRNASNAQIASNIEDLQFEFLADENANGTLTDDPWRSDLASYGALSPSGGKAVRAVRIWVLAMSDTDFTYTDTNTYVYPNSPYAASSPAAQAPIASPANGEHRHRYLASAVVYLRNAGLS